MANDILVEPSAEPTAVPVATDDVGGRQFQVVKVAYGAEDSATYVDSTNPLPVEVSNFPTADGLTDAQLRASAVSVSGPLTDVQLRATAVPISDGGGSVTVDGTVGISGGVEITNDTGNAIPVSGTFYQATQPVSASSLPLPTDASTETTLSALKSAVDALSAKITACNTGAVVLDATTLAALESITATISGSVAVTGPLTDAQLRATALPISGTVTANTGLTPLTDAQLRATAVPVSGTISTGLSQPLTDTQLRASAVSISDGGSSITVDGTVAVSGTVPVSGTFYQATQPVSASALPLPTGASTETTLSALKTAVDSLSAKITACNTGSVTLDAGTLAALENITATISGSVAVTGPLTDTQLRATAVPVSGTVTANTGLAQPLTDTQLRATALPVSGTFFQTTQPVSIASPVSVTGTFYQATQPVSGPLTDTELRATAVPVSGTVTANTGLTQPLTDAQLREEPVETSGFMDWFLRCILRAVGRLSFDTSNQLRTAVSGSVSISSGTVTTVTTMSTGNMSIGDMGKPATVQLATRTLSSGNTKRNLIRS